MPPITDFADCTKFRQTLERRPLAAMHATVLILFALIGAGLPRTFPPGRGQDRLRQPPLRRAALPLLGEFARDLGQLGLGLGAGGPASLFRETLDVPQLLQLLFGGRGEAEESLDVVLQFLRVQPHQHVSRLPGVRFGHEDLHDPAFGRRSDRGEDLRRRLGRRRPAAVWRHQGDLRPDGPGQERLSAERSVSQHDLDEARMKAAAAEETLRRLELPVSDPRRESIRRELAWIEKDYTVRTAELEAQRIAKEGEWQAARRELVNLRLQREQATVRAPLDGVVVRGVSRLRIPR